MHLIDWMPLTLIASQKEPSFPQIFMSLILLCLMAFLARQRGFATHHFANQTCAAHSVCIIYIIYSISVLLRKSESAVSSNMPDAQRTKKG